MKSLAVKISLAVTVLIALALALLPKVIGAGIEQATLDRLIALIPPETESQFEIRRNEFSKGWFSSSATIELIYTPITADAITLSMDFDIEHGPLLQTGDGLSIGIAHANIEPSIHSDLFDIELADLPFLIPDITLSLLARFDQSLRLNMNISELSFSDTTEEFNFEGLDANLDIAADLSARFSLEMGELAAINNIDNSNVLVAGMTITSSTAQLNDILAESRAMLSIPSISSTLPLPFSMSDIGITNDLQASATMEGFSETYQEIHIANIESEVPVSSFSWLFEIKQLNNELVRDCYRLLSELQNKMSSDADALSAELDELTQELYLLVLQNPLELNNRIEANSYGDDHTADLRVLWAGLRTLNDPEELDITEAIAALSMTLEISLDLEAILRSLLAELVDPYVQQGYLNIANGRVMVEASLQQSVLRVNGEEISLDQFF